MTDQENPEATMAVIFVSALASLAKAGEALDNVREIMDATREGMLEGMTATDGKVRGGFEEVAVLAACDSVKVAAAALETAITTNTSLAELFAAKCPGLLKEKNNT